MDSEYGLVKVFVVFNLFLVFSDSEEDFDVVGISLFV